MGDLPDKDRQLPDNFSPIASHRWEDSYPENGFVLKGAKADLLTDRQNYPKEGTGGTWITFGSVEMR